jgi:DNA-binding phage protein
MAVVLTREFRETVQARAQRDTRFRRALLTEAVNELLAGDMAAGKALLRDYINATLGFERLGSEVGRSSKSLQRMLGPSGNPTAENLLAILKALQAYEEVTITVRLGRDAA